MLKVYVLFSSDDILSATVKPGAFHLLMPVFFYRLFMDHLIKRTCNLCKIFEFCDKMCENVF